MGRACHSQPERELVPYTGGSTATLNMKIDDEDSRAVRRIVTNGPNTLEAVQCDCLIGDGRQRVGVKRVGAPAGEYAQLSSSADLSQVLALLPGLESDWRKCHPPNTGTWPLESTVGPLNSASVFIIN